MEKQSTSSTCAATLCRAFYPGTVEYGRALALQERLAHARGEGVIPDTLLLLQHPPVITLGAAATETNLVASRALLASRGIEVMRADRGGDITAHEPGQLVGYPVMELTVADRDVPRYVRRLEEVAIRVLADYGIAAGRDPLHPGVWVGVDKVCAIGVRVSRWITRHGFAFNICNDFKTFSYITPCGIADRGVTSLSRLLGKRVGVEEVLPYVMAHFAEAFGLDVEESMALAEELP